MGCGEEANPASLHAGAGQEEHSGRDGAPVGDHLLSCTLPSCSLVLSGAGSFCPGQKCELPSRRHELPLGHFDSSTDMLFVHVSKNVSLCL